MAAAIRDPFKFRRANRDDIKIVLDMIQELADFEKMSDGPKLTTADLIRDAGLNGGQEYCHVYVLDLHDADTAAADQAIIIGYSICFFSYSTWQGRSYFMEDIYVRPQYRGRGAGARLFCEVAAKAKEYNCPRMDFHVLAWNPAREFYAKLGATDLTTTEEWHFYRLHAEQIEKLTRKLTTT